MRDIVLVVLIAIVAAALVFPVFYEPARAAGRWATVSEWRAIPPFRTRGPTDIEAKIVRVDGREYVVFRSGQDIEVIER